MTNLDTLTEAFAELERRADAAPARPHVEVATSTQPRLRVRMAPVAATVLAVLGVATGAALLASGDGSSALTGTPPAGSHSSATQSHAARTPAPASRIPATPAELESRLRTVLGDTATFTVTDTGAATQLTVPSATRAPGAPAVPRATAEPTAKPNGAAIVGTLTASGVTGGFDFQIFRASPGEHATCDDPDSAGCTVHRLADGSSLAVGRERLRGSANGITYQVELVRSDGAEFVMHVSNERDPKGESTVLAAHPPLTTLQMTTIVTSNRW